MRPSSAPASSPPPSLRPRPRVGGSLALSGALALSLLLPVALVACSGTDKTSGVAGAKLPQGARKETVDHEACEESGHRVETLDTNNDGKPDIRQVFDKSTGKELCRIVDLNHDGKPDLYEYFEADGVTPRRREFCFVDDGVVNAIEVYANGRLVRREYDTTGQHRIDTWDFFDPNGPVDAKGKPKPVRRERDTTGDGKVDQWWVWDGNKLTITMDKTGSGKPDPATQIVIEGDAGAAAAAPPTASAPPATTTSAPPPLTPSDAGAPTTPQPLDAGGRPR